MFDGRIKRAGEQRFAGEAIPKTRGIRIARVESVYNNGKYAGTVDLSFLDGAGGRKHVMATQKTSDSFDLPSVGSVVLVGFDIHHTCYILGYLPVGFPKKLETNEDTGGSELPKLQPGDKAFQGVMGQGIYFLDNGDILIDNGRGGRIKMNYISDTTEVKDINFSLTTEAGVIEFGLVQRDFTDELTGEVVRAYDTTDGLPFSNSSDKIPTELVIKMARWADGDSATAPPVDNPVVEIRMGNVVDANGVIDTSKNLDIIIRNEDGNIKSEFIMNDDGKIKLKGSGIELGHTPDSGLVKYKQFEKIMKALIEAFNSHTHTGDLIPPDEFARQKTTNLPVSTCESQIVRVN